MTEVRSALRTSAGVLLVVVLLWLTGLGPREITFPNMWPFLNRNPGVRDDDGNRRYELKVRQRPRNGLVAIVYTVDGGKTDNATLRGDTWRRQVWARSVTLIAGQETTISILECWILDPLTGAELSHDVANQRAGEVECAAGG